RRIGIVELELESGVGDGRRRDATFGDEVGPRVRRGSALLPFLLEEERRKGGWRRGGRRCRRLLRARGGGDERHQRGAERETGPTSDPQNRHGIPLLLLVGAVYGGSARRRLSVKRGKPADAGRSTLGR